MRLRALGFLAVFFLLPLAARASSVARPGEWVVTRGERSLWPSQWGPGIRLLRVFGDGRRALVRSRKRPRAYPGVVAVQPNYVYSAGAVAYANARSGELAQSWALANDGTEVAGTKCLPGRDIGAVDAWKTHEGTRATIVAVIDSGVDVSHEDLRTNLWTNPREVPGNGIDDDANGFVDDVRGWNFIRQAPDVNDDLDHGTFIAGILAADTGNGKGVRGILREVRVMPLKVLDASGFGTTASTVAAIDYAVRGGAHVLNLSWGGTERDEALADAIERAGRAGVLVVASSGNDRKDNDVDPKPYYPASFDLPNLIAVSAYDCRDEIGSFASYGKRSVQIGAPGVSITSTVRGGYRLGSGTSFAAPQVTGVAALLRSYLPGLSVDALRARLLATSEVIHYYEKERLATAGRVSAAGALADRRPPRPTAPLDWIESSEKAATPHPYPNKHSQTWKFRKPGATRLRVHFRDFSTERAFDVVSLLDARGRRFASYSGDRGDFWSADALGDTIEVQFYSDYVLSKHGFEIDAVGASEQATDWDRE